VSELAASTLARARPSSGEGSLAAITMIAGPRRNRRLRQLRAQLAASAAAATTGGPLSGVKVVEMCQMISGPLAAQILADQGAEVVKIENANGVGDRFRGGRGMPSPGLLTQGVPVAPQDPYQVAPRRGPLGSSPVGRVP
jgi:hypothetical protein